MSYSVPTADFVSSTLNGAIVAGATSATIGTGLNIPAANGILHVDYDSTTAVGSDNGPETIAYATYNSGTGAIAGLTRGLAGTNGVAHGNGAKISAGYSAAHLTQDAATTWTANASTFSYGTADSPTFTMTVGSDITSSVYPGVRVKLQQDQTLSHYWKFEDNSTPSVGSATMADIGTPTYTAGKFNKALTLNGSNQALSITDAAAFKPTDNFTIGCWFKTSNTGAYKSIYQSYSDNTNGQGIRLLVKDTNVMFWSVGAGSADDVSSLTGTTTVTDGNWHYVVVSVRNNYTQVYLDGKLEMSGYTATPTYNATNYVRIGCANSAASNILWFNGQIDDLFLINGYALDEQYIAAKYAAGTEQGTSNITLTKYFLCTASSYSAPNTTVTLYGGTDHSLANATISSVYYSPQKAPYGFPLSADKWTQSFASYVSADQATPADQWYNLGSVQLSVPIGAWNLFAKAYGVSTASSYAGLYMTLSTSATVETYTDTTVGHMINATETGGCLTANKSIKYGSKTTIYLLAKRITSASTLIRFSGAGGATVIKATSTLL